MATTTIDDETIKSRQQATWSSGDYAVIGTTLQITGELLCEAVDVARRRAGARRRRRQRQRGAGRGPPWCVRHRDRLRRRRCSTGRACAPRPRACRLDVREGDAEALPFAGCVVRRRAVDVRRDVHAEPGTGGARAAAGVPARRTHRPRELDARRLRRRDVQGRRPIRPAAGRCAFAARMGHRRRGSRSCSGAECEALTMRRREFVFRYRSPEHWLDAFRTYYGPIAQGVRRARPGRTRRVRARPARPRVRYDTGRNGAFRASSAYLQAVAVKAA